MTEYEILRLLWWAVLGVLLIGIAVMDGFDMGSAILLPFVGRTDMERRIVINTVGPVWEGNQVWLILGGGAIFAAWPPLYAVAFSGFYLAMLLLLLSLILRPVGFKYRSKLDGTRWRTTWDIALFLGGLVPALVFGVAFGNVLQGVPFRFDDTLRMTYTGNLFGLFNPFALLCGLVSVAMLDDARRHLARLQDRGRRAHARPTGRPARIADPGGLVYSRRRLGRQSERLRAAVVRRDGCGIEPAEQARRPAGGRADDELRFDAGRPSRLRCWALSVPWSRPGSCRCAGCAGWPGSPAPLPSPASSRPPASACSRSCCRHRSTRSRA